MRKIGQFVYNKDTYLEGLFKKNEITGELQIAYEPINIFESRNIYKLGIQAPPGTKIKINTTQESVNDTIIEINQYGIYELDLKDGLGVIYALYFVSGAQGQDEEGKPLFFPEDITMTFYDRIIVDYIEEVNE